MDGAGLVHLAHPGAATASLRPPTGFAHNALIVQEANCFTTLHGPVTPGPHCSVSDASYVASELTATCSHWFWPMSGGLDHLGRLAVFYVEMANERGSGAASPAHPVAVWTALFNAATFNLLGFAPAPASSANVVYGAAVETDDSFSYLFGWSYDQFNLPDPTSPPPSQMFVARVPAGRFDQQPQVLERHRLVCKPGYARCRSAPISAGPANPMQPRLLDGTWISAVKVDDWNGSTVRVDVAPAPEGPWTHGADGDRSEPNARRAHQHVRRAPDAVAVATGNLVVALSNNAWQMDPLALDNPTIYQPRLFELAAPSSMPAPQLSATTEPLGFVPTSPPIRAIDTARHDSGRPGQVLRVSLAGIVADGARAAVIDLAAVDPSGSGFLTAWSCDEADAVDVEPQLPRRRDAGDACGRHVGVGRIDLCLQHGAETDVLVDVTGSYSTAPSALLFHPHGTDAHLRLARCRWHLAGRRNPRHRRADRGGRRRDQRDHHRARGIRLRHRVPVPGSRCRWCRTSTTCRARWWPTSCRSACRPAQSACTAGREATS